MATTEYITKDQAKEAFINYMGATSVRIGVLAKHLYDEITSADVAEIVRCKDCKDYRNGICNHKGLCVNKSPNGFCDWGKRREHE